MRSEAALCVLNSLARHLAWRMRPCLAIVLVAWPGASSAQGATHVADTTSRRNGLPLVAERIARFRATEGTWMSLDVSPDGRTVVFDLLGDLYTLPITGGTARRLTSGMALNRQPRFSPDGRQLVFVSDRGGSENVWIADRDGRNARQLSVLGGYDPVGAVTSPVWSPDGLTIVVAQRLGAMLAGLGDDARQFMWLLAAYDVATGKMRWISDTTPGRARSVLDPFFDARRRLLYVAMHLDPVSTSSGLGHWRVGRLDLATGRLVPEMGATVGRIGMRPAVSPNGRWLVYGSSSGSHVGLRVRNLSTAQERWLVSEALDDPSGQEHFEPRNLLPGYAFTPDSRFIVAAYGGKLHRIDVATGRTALIPFMADVERALGPRTVYQFSLPDTAVRLQGVLQAALSPDGMRVAFSALDRVWVMELPHAGQPPAKPQRATADSAEGEFYPSWSPDGESIVYSSWRDGEGGAIRCVRVLHDQFSRPPLSERLTSDTALYFHTAVTPDGDRVVAARLDLPPDRVLPILGRFFPPRLVKPTLVWVSKRGRAAPRIIAPLPPASGVRLTDLVKQIHIADSGRIHIGLSSWRWDGSYLPAALAVRTWDGVVRTAQQNAWFLDGVLSPDGRRAMVSIGNVLYEVSAPIDQALDGVRVDTLDLARAEAEPFGGVVVAARRWGTALKPWVSWSRDGRRVIFAQGGVLYVGDVPTEGWTKWQRVGVPLTIALDRPRGTLAFRGARLITMRDGEIIERGDLVVRDNRIAAVGPSGKVAIPKGARIIDAHGMTILPGYVDIHEHGARPHGVHPGQSWISLLELANGVTAVRDPYSQADNDDFAYADRERADEFLGPRMFSTGVPYLGPYPPIRTLNDAREAVRRHAEDFRTETFKVYTDFTTDRRARQLLSTAAREAGLNATVHSNYGDHAVTSAIDGLAGIEHEPGIKVYDDVATLIARSRATYTQTYLGALFGSIAYMAERYGTPLDYPRICRYVPESEREATCTPCTGEVSFVHAPLTLNTVLPIVGGAARIAARGGQIGMGSHGNVVGIGFHWEMWLHALGGMPNHEILRSATSVGATALGHAADFGRLEAGWLADLQALDKNPLVDIHNTTSIRYVMKNGRLYQADDLTEVWPRHKPLAIIYVRERREKQGACPRWRRSVTPLHMTKSRAAAEIRHACQR